VDINKTRADLSSFDGLDGTLISGIGLAHFDIYNHTNAIDDSSFKEI